MASPRASHGVGPESCAEMLMPAMTIGAVAQRDAAVQLGDEVERIELEEHVVAEEAVDVEPGRLGVELDSARRTAPCST